MASTRPSDDELAQAAGDDILNMFQHFRSKEEWLASQWEQKRPWVVRLARLRVVLLAMIKNFDEGRVTRQQRDRLASLIDQPRHLDIEIVNCNGYRELSRYQLIAINKLRAFHLERFDAFEKQMELDMECWNMSRIWQAQPFGFAAIGLSFVTSTCLVGRMMLAALCRKVSHLERQLRIQFDEQGRLVV